MKRFQIKRIIKTKNSLFLGGLIAVGIFLSCAAQKQVMQESGGIIKVMISGVEQQELKFCEVKAIASGKEYLVSNKFEMLLGLKTDTSTGRVIQEGPIVGLFTIEGVPVGPAEVRVRLKQENLPAQKVEVKRDTEVSVNFEFKLNKVILSGKVTQLGKPLSDWVLIFERADGKPAPFSEGVKTASDGSYKHKLNPGTYKINLSNSSIEKIQGVTAEVWSTMYTTTYTVTKTETLDLEVSTLKKKDSKKSAQVTQAQGPFVISGKVTQLGNPMSGWLLVFQPAGGKPAPTIAGVQTASDGSYNHKLNPGTYEITLSKPSIVELVDRKKIEGWLPMFTTTYTVTKTETLNLEVSTLEKIESKKSAEVAQAQGPFVINDKRLLQLSGPDPCRTDAEITASSSQGYQTRGIVERFGGNFHLWCNGAKHTWIGRHENIQLGAIAVIDSDKENPLQFRIDKEKGYVYQKGKGAVTMPEGRLIKLPMSVEVTPYAQEKSPDRSISEKFVAQIISSWIADSFKVSPNSKRVACVAKEGNKWCVVVDGKEGKQYDNIGKGTLIFSPDSRRVAYMAKEGNKWCVVVDGKEEKQYDGIGEGSIIFSPDSTRMAYKAGVGNKWCVVVDGKEGKQYDNIGMGTPIFSADSRRVAYMAMEGNKWWVVVDGKEGKQYDGIGQGTLIFSADSRHVAYAAMEGNKWFVVVNGKEEKQYDGIIGNKGEKTIFFDTAVSLHYLAQKINSIYLVEENID
jgi:hypothetical protein